MNYKEMDLGSSPEDYGWHDKNYYPITILKQIEKLNPGTRVVEYLNHRAYDYEDTPIRKSGNQESEPNRA